jgi:hypothetical protein
MIMSLLLLRTIFNVTTQRCGAIGKTSDADYAGALSV